jgi:hypothetical protein
MNTYIDLGEKAYMARMHDQSIENLRAHKLAFLGASVRRFVRFWTGYWSFSPAYLRNEPLDVPNVPFCSALTLLTISGIIWRWRRDRETLLPFVLLVLVFPIPYYLTHSSMDYRAPIEPQLAILTTAGALALRDRLKAANEDPNEDAIEVGSPDLDLVAS